jgi:hypothetical protein
VNLKLACMIAAVVMGLIGLAPAQVHMGAQHVPGITKPKSPEDEQREKIERDMAKRANEERQQQLQRDTDQLLKLATELKQQVGKSNQNVLSLDVIKKAEEIERLAHSVREKMKGS